MPLVALVLGMTPALADPTDPKQVCTTEGLWFEEKMAFTTRLAGARWKTWYGGPAIDEATAPAGQGWVERSSRSLTFAYDGGQSYPYEWRFEEDCTILRMWHPVQELRLQRVSSEGDGKRQGG